jgi:transcriptional regulator PpsR
VPGIDDPLAARIVVSAADVALVLDETQTIVGVSLGERLKGERAWYGLEGKSLSEVLLPDSHKKGAQLVQEALDGETARAREINLRIDGLGDVPLRFSGVLLDDEHVVALGRDLRPMAQLQQRMVSAQQAMELEYRRLRQADTHYRVLFHVCSEGVLVSRGDDRSIIEANPAAAQILGEPAATLQGKSLFALFDPGSREELATWLGTIQAGGTSEIEMMTTAPSGADITASASLFRQAGQPLILFRFWPSGGRPTAAERELRMMKAVEALPDGFVVTDPGHRILGANAAFCDLVQRANETQVVGQALGQWLGRPGVDLNIIDANLREHGSIRHFATVLRGEFGTEQEAVVTAVSALDGVYPCLGFTIRPVSSRPAEDPTATFLPRSVEQLRELVGRVPLKDLVQESADLIERLCIEAALDVSGNNRAAAAQLLGLSRQSLYSKLRRHGLGEFQPS